MKSKKPDRFYGWDIEPLNTKKGASDKTRWRACLVTPGTGRFRTHAEASRRAGELNDETEGKTRPAIGRRWRQENYQAKAK